LVPVIVVLAAAVVVRAKDVPAIVQVLVPIVNVLAKEPEVRNPEAVRVTLLLFVSSVPELRSSARLLPAEDENASFILKVPVTLLIVIGVVKVFPAHVIICVVLPANVKVLVPEIVTAEPVNQLP
jgi:hypothetical protein